MKQTNFIDGGRVSNINTQHFKLKLDNILFFNEVPLVQFFLMQNNSLQRVVFRMCNFLLVTCHMETINEYVTGLGVIVGKYSENAKCRRKKAWAKSG